MERIETVAMMNIPPEQIEKNPYNPRLIFDEDSLTILRESIRTVGILVPLTVYQREADHKYVIVDGERRWRCAIDLKLKDVPVNIIAQPSVLSNLVIMLSSSSTIGRPETWRRMFKASFNLISSSS